MIPQHTPYQIIVLLSNASCALIIIVMTTILLSVLFVHLWPLYQLHRHLGLLIGKLILIIESTYNASTLFLA